MKVIIIEGTDNTGKNTLINSICENYNNVMLIHCTKPEGNTPTIQAMNQNALFNKYANNIVSYRYNNIADIVIFNRAWYGEYVYGTLYRDRLKENVIDMIEDIEKKLNNANFVEIYYIQLICDSVKLLTDNDDGKSISNKAEHILKETELFKEIFNKSQVNKIMLNVNDGDNFRDKNAILNDVISFIQHK